MTEEELRKAAHLARRGVKGKSDPNQRTIDLMKRDGSVWFDHPTLSGRGMWCPKKWVPDWDLGYPIVEIDVPENAE